MNSSCSETRFLDKHKLHSMHRGLAVTKRGGARGVE